MHCIVRRRPPLLMRSCVPRLDCYHRWLDLEIFFLPPEHRVYPRRPLSFWDEVLPIVLDLVAPRLLDDDEKSIDEIFVGDDLLGKASVHMICLGLSDKGFRSLMWLPGCC